MKEPIIIIGMHRSGTSLLSRILEKMNVFMGHDLEENHESKFFIKTNNKLLYKSGATSKNPNNLKIHLDDRNNFNLSLKMVKKRLSSSKSYIYLGKDLFNQYKSIFNLEIPWGWKDPRNTYSISIWLEIFPKAKIIHIYRNGIDVANSLLNKSNYWKNNTLLNIIRKPFLFSLRGVLIQFSKRYRPRNLDDAFKIWVQYINQAKEMIEKYKKNTLEIKYEDLLQNPSIYIKKLAEFCNLKVDQNKIIQIIKIINPSRKFIYKNNIQLKKYYFKKSEILRKFGY